MISLLPNSTLRGTLIVQSSIYVVWHTISVSILSSEFQWSWFRQVSRNESTSLTPIIGRNLFVSWILIDLFRIRQRVNFFNDFDICIHFTWDNGIKHCFSNIPFEFWVSNRRLQQLTTESTEGAHCSLEARFHVPGLRTFGKLVKIGKQWLRRKKS